MNKTIFSPGPTAYTVRDASGEILQVPDGWVLLPPGDAGLTRRVKAAGDHWPVQEKTLPGLIADSVEQAFDALQPARLFVGRLLVYEGHHNRRVISKVDGLVLNTWLEKLDRKCLKPPNGLRPRAPGLGRHR